MIYGVIYKIENNINGMVYIGQTINNVEKYIKRVYISRGGEERIKIKNAIKKYGIENFKFVSIIDQAFSKDELDDKEIFWINYYNSINNGYNCKTGGSKGLHCDETKKKISNTKKGTKVWNKGIPMDESRKAMLINLSKGRTPWNKGSKMSQDVKEKVSASRKGKTSGINHPAAKIITIQNIHTKETHSGLVTELGKKFNFSYSNMINFGKTKGWVKIETLNGFTLTNP